MSIENLIRPSILNASRATGAGSSAINLSDMQVQIRELVLETMRGEGRRTIPTRTYHPTFQGNPQYRPAVPPKPQQHVEPMDVDRSMQTKHIEYANRPNQYQTYVQQREPSQQFQSMPPKHQRSYNITCEEDDEGGSTIEPTILNPSTPFPSPETENP
uniref:Uncharacterized protein n=1 Tax=Glossina pallidipes TaxID=7398 RepID=A0A1A9ZXD5_GLOPL